jgi:hypothetical protein
MLQCPCSSGHVRRFQCDAYLTNERGTGFLLVIASAATRSEPRRVSAHTQVFTKTRHPLTRAGQKEIPKPVFQPSAEDEMYEG